MKAEESTNGDRESRKDRIARSQFRTQREREGVVTILIPNYEIIGVFIEQFMSHALCYWTVFYEEICETYPSVLTGNMARRV